MEGIIYVCVLRRILMGASHHTALTASNSCWDFTEWTISYSYIGIRTMGAPGASAPYTCIYGLCTHHTSPIDLY